MKYLVWAAAAVSFGLPASVLAGGHEGPAGPSDGPRRGPPPEVVSQANLAGAGLLPLMYSEREYGLVQSRTGESRNRIGNASSPAGPSSNYAHEAQSVVAPFYFRYGQPGKTSYIMGRLTYIQAQEEPNVTQSDSTNLLGWIGYQDFYSPDAMWSVQLGFTNLDAEGSGSKVERDSINLRFDHVRKLSDNWGFAGRAYYSMGETSVLVKGSGISYTQDEDQIYLQGEFAGSYSSDEIASLPKGWNLRPVLGANYQRYFLADTTNSVGGTESGGEFDVGNVWAKATLAKSAKPGTWAPNFTIGLEHAFKDDYDEFIDEPTHAIFGVGASILIPGGGNTIAVTLDHREGLNGVRRNTSLTTAFNFSF